MELVSILTRVLPPEVPETPMSPDLLQPLQILSQLVVQTVSQDLKTDFKKVTHAAEPR